MNRLKLFYVNEQYICYLRKFEHIISENQNSRRPYCGAVIFNQKILYFIPLSSPKEKYKKMKYRRLLKRQADYIRAYSEKIQNKVEKLYDLVVKGQPRNIYEKNLIARCCDFKKLEEEMQHYKKGF
ncbi:MAG: hypothetical protein HFG34_01330 [Eubacterium sp.]|nr:hypothetical protein [Eubacterium sp.]